TFTRLDAVGNPLTIQPRNFICGYVPQRGEPGAPVISRETSLFPAIMYRDRNGTSPSGPLLGPQPYVLINELLVKADEFIGVNVPDLDGFGMKRDQIRLSLNTDYELPSGYSASVLAGWNDTRMNTMGDHDFSDTQSWYSADPKFGRDWSIEARISSPQHRRLRGMIGATYYDQEFITSGSGGLTVSACSNTSCLAGPLVTTTPASNGNVAEVMGVFGSVSFDILRNLTLDIEGRYAEDKRSVIQTGASFSSTFKQTTPRVILTYKPADETTLYAQVSRGALPGVTNGLVSTCSDQTFTVPYANPLTGQLSTASECEQISAQLTADQYKGATDSQELDAYEIGWKQTLFDRRLSFNVNAWYYEWKNRPYGLSVRWVRDSEDPALRDGIPNAFANGLGVSVAGGQKLWGSELETALAITDRWEAQLSAAWTDNEFGSFFDRNLQTQFGFINLSGLKAARTPKWQGNLSTTYRAPLRQTDWTWYMRGDAAYSGEYWADGANLARAQDYVLVNGRIGVQRDDLRLELFVRNLLQEDAWATVDEKSDFTVQGIVGGWPRGIAVVPQEKRTFGLRAVINF
ncbi:TonB-dependent receptor, partial [Povalibacter sp.]|uniref:TonB-dependent receptor n=1 Tax=Povalibacter sp. TaxID=1962978 RepID=UPI002F3E8DFF